MRKETKTIEIYKFDELNDAAKEKAREWFRNGALDYDWWDCTYDDAGSIGLKITEFNLNRGLMAKGNFVVDAFECAQAILKNHGDQCRTHKTACEFIGARDSIIESAERNADGEFVSEYDVDVSLDECEREFLKSLLDDYAWMLQQEYEHLLSDECVDENIRGNEYEFTEGGKVY